MSGSKDTLKCVVVLDENVLPGATLPGILFISCSFWSR